MKSMSYKRTITEKIQLKGFLSEDTSTITCMDGEEEVTVSIKDYLERFAGNYIEITMQNKNEQDLSHLIDSTDEDEDDYQPEDDE